MKKTRRSKNLSAFIFLAGILLAIVMTLGTIDVPLYAAPTDSTYKGAEYCMLCHAEEYEAWNQTNHAHAVMLIQNASGDFYSVGSTSNLAGTPSRVYVNDTFRLGSCRNCHVTGGNNFDPLGANQTWPERETDPGKFLNIQCEVCHGAYQSHGPTNPAMTINYSSALCELCHTGTHDFSHSQSAHADSLTDLLASGHPSDTCLSCMSTQGSIGLPVTLNTTDLEGISCVTCHDPHSHTYESQLRYENSTVLCGQCHTGSRHPQSIFFIDSAHDMAGLECTSCHGSGTHYAHGHESEVVNHTWGIYGMYYPYNQTRSEEPIVCSTCHTQEWSTTQLGVIQDTISEIVTNVTNIIEDANTAIGLANATSGVDQTKVNQAAGYAEQAEDQLDLVENDASIGFHNPEKSFALLSDAMRLANNAETLALTAQQEATVSDLQSLHERQLTNMRNITIGGTIGALIAGLAIGFFVQRLRE